MENLSVNALVDSYQNHLPREICTNVAKDIFEQFSDKETLLKEYRLAIDNLLISEQLKVINCTGTLLHTNLGRAQTNVSFEGHASNIEFDLGKQTRGKRSSYLSYSMNLLLGSEAVCFVNNNASSLFLTLHSLKKTQQVDAVIISRGEIVEIGGSYRLPEIIAETGLKLIEVGTTNKTHKKDYSTALKGNPHAVVLKVHRSNFSISGFVEEVSTKELKIIAKEYGALVIHDIGSGLVVDKKFLEKNKISFFSNEQHVQDSLLDGADLVMFSGDKLFGSLQAGIIAGNEELVTNIKESPLFRTYRCSPIVNYELQKTTGLYLSKKEGSIPLWHFLTLSYEELLNRIKKISGVLDIKHTVEESYSLIGGGSMPDVKIPSPVIAIHTSIDNNLISKLASLDIPIIPRIKDEKIIFDLRSSFEIDDELIANALKKPMTVLATAGHVDHGKSTLVSFLTQQETDRLAEEKNRGLTINLGYTFYEFNDEITSIVDVPGHSDFFKNTMAGFSNADAILFVIDSTQGWSEQSEQHFRALIGLSKLNIIFIFTKLDLPESNVEENKLMERISKIKDLNYTILKFNKNSTKRGDLIKDIQEFLKTFSNNYSSFWVDRSFVIDGIGKVITGTAGKNFVVDNLYLYPRAENVEIRSIESVNKDYTQTSGSQRIAISLKKSNDITPKRGDLVSNDVLQISDFILFEILSEDADKMSNNTIKLFVGTTNKLVQKFYLLNVNKKQYAIAKLNELVAIPAGEKMVLHNIDSNQFYGCEFMTPLLNKNLVKHLIRNSKDRTEYDSLFELVPFTTISQGVDDINIGSLYTDSATLNNIHKHIRENFEKINKQGVAKYFYEIFFIKEEDLGDLFSKFEDLSIKENQIKLTQDTSDEDVKILKLIYKDLGDELAVPNIDLKKYDREIVKNLFLEGKLIRVSKNILYTEEHLKTVVNIVHKLPNIFTISQFKELSGLSRKYAIPLLEALDNKLITKKLDTEGSREKLVS